MAETGADRSAVELYEVLDIPELQELMNHFYALTGIGVGVLDLDGKVLVGTGWQDICSRFHRAVPESCALCHQSDRELSSGVTPGTFKAYRCKNNLWDVATPIMLGDRHVGNIFLGQFLYDDEEPDYELFRAQARRFGYDEQAYLEALSRVPRFSRDEIDKAMRFYASFARLISKSNYTNLKLREEVRERRLTEEALRKSDTVFEKFMEHCPIYVFFKDERIRSIRLSRNYEKMLGRPLQELLGKSMDELFPSELARSMVEDDRRILHEGRVLTVEEDLDGRSYSTTKFPIFENGVPRYLAGFTIDITERKRAMQALQATLKEKEILLAEIHHRVKNNLNIIVSLLRLQRADMAAPDLIQTFQEAESRILSISLVHEQLYGSLEQGRVHCGQYFSKLAEGLAQVYDAKARGVTISVHADEFLDVVSAVPCGLIVNELLTNALKHAFEQGQAGEIRLTLAAQGDGQRRMVLEVRDTGRGVPPSGFTRRLGLEIVWGLARQLDGTPIFESSGEAGGGTCVRIDFSREG